MREYETVIVLHPSYEDKEVEAEIQAISDIITAAGGAVLEVDRWGRRRLAYEIQKAHEGIYTLIRWRGAAKTPEEIRRRFRLNERMLRFMTIISEGPHPAPGRPEAEGHASENRSDEGRAAEPPATSRGTAGPASEGGPDAVPASAPAPATSADGLAAGEGGAGRTGD